jgi:CheY-like chemotaxis protein
MLEKRFLIIDDSQPVLTVYSQLLEQAGHSVITLTSCDEAMQNILEFKPDCILCDMMLPGMDGLEFYQMVRNSKMSKQPVFIVISGKQFEYDRRNALKLGVDAYLTKPINHATFVSEVTAIIDGRDTSKK